jgi:molecular chaperone IbpA
LADFTPEEVSITAEQNVLIVEGRKSERGEHQYLLPGNFSTPLPPFAGKGLSLGPAVRA